ncbi:MAG TPA: Asp-tRNA(Asn)/Glu-tRNA(Gln) amidotransferase subunit GatA, partial [Anaerolineales bacterium]|nr:Asp-tRNA(Asn)/Glu-tRNA(Gln) amidotransferase subunit GatA [Anaerolineales bacterium]
MTALTDLTLTEMQHGLKAGSFSSRELVSAALDRVAALEPQLRAFLHVASEYALSRADEMDRLRKKGSRAPLLGVPVAIKDVLTVEGLPCTCGSRILEGFVPPFTATAVRRLQDAGAVVLGKTNTDEFAMGSSTENSAYGVTHNPWDVTRVPGGSSGGSATAVAARYVPAALGTDTGGSVRQPAALCGVTGLKTTYGRVSRYGLVAFGSSLDTVGAFGRTAEDAAAIFSVMAGPDARDATTADVGIPEIDLHPMEIDTPLQGLRVGVPREYFLGGIQPAVERAVQDAVDVLKALGAEVREVSLPHTQYALPVYYIIAPAEASANLARFDGVRYGPREPAEDMWQVYYRTRGRRFGPEVTRRVMIGTYALSAGYYDAYYGQAQRVRTLIRQDFEAAFGQVDVIAAPTTPGTAFPIGAHDNDPLAMYLEDAFTLPANLAGIPGISVAAGFDAQNL